MLDSEYGPVNTTIRVHESYLLRKNHYDRMLAADDYESAIRVLHDTVYRDGVDKAIATKDYEEMLMNHLQDTYRWVTQQSPDQPLIELITLPYAYHNIEVLFKGELTNREFNHTLIEIGAYPTYEYRRAIKLRDSTVLPQKYVDNINELHDYFDEMPSLNELDVYLDRVYFDHKLNLAEQIDDAEVTSYVIYTIDLNNLSVFLRALVAGQGRNHMQAVLSEGGTLPVKFYLDLMNNTYDNVVAQLRATDFGDIIEKSTTRNILSLSQLQRNIDDAQMEYLESAKMKVFGPLPIIAFLNAKETEVKNIRLILTSKLNSIDSAIVRDRMRLNYAV